MKLKLTEITPAKFACGQLMSSCPAVFKTEQATYVIIGRVCDGDQPDLNGRVGSGEMAIEISGELLETALGLHPKTPTP